MTKILYVEASPRKANASSIGAADAFLEALVSTRTDLKIDQLDLWNAALPEFAGALIAAKYAKLAGRELDADEEAGWEDIRALVSRFSDADAIVIATPMWNFGIPYKLKHWIDLITQPSLTFVFDPQTGYSPVIAPRPTLVILSSAGDYSEGDSYGRPDLASPFLEAALAFLGLTSTVIERIGPTAGPPMTTRAAKSEAIDRLKARATTFLGQAR